MAKQLCRGGAVKTSPHAKAQGRDDVVNKLTVTAIFYRSLAQQQTKGKEDEYLSAVSAGLRFAQRRTTASGADPTLLRDA